VITESDNGKVISSTTEIINDFMVTRPTPLQKVNFFPGGNYNVQWTSAKDGKVYEMTIRFHYLEINASYITDTTEKSIDWLIFTTKKSNSTPGGEIMNFDIAGDAFYNYMNYSLCRRSFCLSCCTETSTLCFLWVVRKWMFIPGDYCAAGNNFRDHTAGIQQH
jgi:hypothetical protein